jgi:hypothetical protein
MTAPALPDLNPTVAHIDTATGEWSKASAQQVQSVAAIERDIRAQLWHVDRLLNAGDTTLQAATGAINTANTQLTHVAPVLDAARGSLEAIPPAIKEITNDAKAPLASFDASMTDLQGLIASGKALVSDPHVTGLIAHADGLVGHAEAITGDLQVVADKETKDFIAPVKWYMIPLKRAGQLWDIGAFAARHY